VIQNGSMEDQRFVLGTINSIVENVREHGLSSPAVIVIGEVVSLHPEFIFEQIEKVTITTDKIAAKSDNGSFHKIYNSLFKWK